MESRVTLPQWILNLQGRLEACGGPVTPERVERLARELVDIGRTIAAIETETDMVNQVRTPTAAESTMGNLLAAYMATVARIEEEVEGEPFLENLNQWCKERVGGGEERTVWWRYSGPSGGEHPVAMALCISRYAQKPVRWKKIHIPRGEISTLLHSPEWLHGYVSRSRWGRGGASWPAHLSREAGDYLKTLDTQGRSWAETVEAAQRLDRRREAASSRVAAPYASEKRWNGEDSRDGVHIESAIETKSSPQPPSRSVAGNQDTSTS